MKRPLLNCVGVEMQSLTKYKCKICDVPVTERDWYRFKTCGSKSCRSLYADQLRAIRQEREASYWEQQEKRFLAAVGKAREIDGSVNEDQVFVVPINQHELVPLSQDRKRAFRTFIHETANAALALEKTESEDFEVCELPSDEITTTACATCQGFCCRGGGETAYLDAKFIRWHMDVTERSSYEVVEAYTRCLPVEAYRDSCLFHSSSGCSLPREMRSNLCNRFRCQDLHQIDDKGLAPNRANFFVGVNERLEAVTISKLDSD